MSAAPFLTLCAELTAPHGMLLIPFTVPLPPPPSLLTERSLSSSSWTHFMSSNPALFEHVDSHFEPEMTAYVQHLIDMTLTSRAEVKSYLQHQAPHTTSLLLSETACVSSPGLSFHGGSLYLPFSLFDPSSAADWAYFFADAPPPASVNLVDGACQHLDEGHLRTMGDLYLPAPSTIVCDGSALPLDPPSCPSSAFLGTSVINLDRRPDRWSAFLSLLDSAPSVLESLSPLSRSPAADGSVMNLADPSIVSQFSLSSWTDSKGQLHNPHSHHGYSAPVIANALSHRGLWNSVAERSTSPLDHLLILEDDVDSFDENFSSSFSSLLARLERDPSWDIVFLGTFSEDIEYHNHRVLEFFPDSPATISFEVTHPPAGSTLAIGGEPVYLDVSIITDVAPNIFSRRHERSRLCVGEGGGEMVCQLVVKGERVRLDRLKVEEGERVIVVELADMFDRIVDRKELPLRVVNQR
ncbi:hypothetical protein TeGR_g8970 [Tetraparma gracilis]|uniref:Uncharacterized protein n=1 Tax=Tetraparma gracilis TaxID=2962635 RepID=A0ABQ6N924_9STRA|nr:hypothetical protein TeGR_g8970 [Tetraparma gracilis]